MKDPKCFICGANEESTLHNIRDCPTARMDGAKLGGPADKPLFFQQLLQLWVTSNLKHKDEDGFPVWATLFCISIRWCWRWRYCFMFGRANDVPQDLGGFIHVRYNETRRSLDANIQRLQRSKVRNEESYII